MGAQVITRPLWGGRWDSIIVIASPSPTRPAPRAPGAGEELEEDCSLIIKPALAANLQIGGEVKARRDWRIFYLFVS